MTNILWLVPDKPENISTGRQIIAQRLRDRGHEVTTIASRTRMARVQPTHGYDVHIASSAAGGFSAPVATLQRRGFVMDHVDPIRQMYRTADYRTAKMAESLQDLAFKLADGILYVYDIEEPRLRHTSAHVEQTTLGVEFDRFAHGGGTATPPDAVAHGDIRPGYGVYVGGLEPIYNIDTMMQAAARVDSHDFVVAGCGSKEAIVRDYAADYDHIHYLGVVNHEQVPALLHRAGAGVCLVDDPHTVKVLEYAAAGLPVVHLDGRARIAYPPDSVTWVDNDVGSVAHGLRTALTHRSASRALREYAQARDFETVVDQYERMVERVA